MMQVDVLKFKSVYSGFLFAERKKRPVVERKKKRTNKQQTDANRFT